GRRAQRFDVLCDVAAALEPFPAVSIDVPAEGSTRHEFLVRPRRRGRFRIERLWLRWRGPLGLMAITRVRNVDADVDAVPDVGSARAAALHWFGTRTFTGLKIERYVGDGSEFESLRPFVPGLDARSIDWKATARHRRVLCRRFRAERNHHVVL